MAVPPPVSADPTSSITINLSAYIEQRERELAQHLKDGIPDYSFSLDRTLRRQIAAFPPLRWAIKGIGRSINPIMQHVYTMEGIAVGPDQYPQIHKLGEECACQLGIAVPHIFIIQQPELNAFTFAYDDVLPTIILTTRLIRGLDSNELKAIIGHECGHVHNLHGAFNTVVQMLTNPLASVILAGAARTGAGVGVLRSLTAIMGTSITLFLARWSRCAEVTCDRAGTICAGDPMAMVRAFVKMQTGGEDELADINIDAYVRQLETVKSTPLRLLELFNTHPLMHKRIEAVQLFGQSDVFRSWRPDAAQSGTARPFAEIDEECHSLISVWDKAKPAATGVSAHG